jgi:hypothetical protein
MRAVRLALALCLQMRALAAVHLQEVCEVRTQQKHNTRNGALHAPCARECIIE